jgi:hypothetical protein
MRLLEKDPRDRFPSALAVYDALAAVDADDPLETTQKFTFVESPHDTISSLPVALQPTVPESLTAIDSRPSPDESTTARSVEEDVAAPERKLGPVALLAVLLLAVGGLSLAVLLSFTGEPTEPVTSEPVATDESVEAVVTEDEVVEDPTPPVESAASNAEREARAQKESALARTEDRVDDPPVEKSARSPEDEPAVESSPKRDRPRRIKPKPPAKKPSEEKTGGEATFGLRPDER